MDRIFSKLPPVRRKTRRSRRPIQQHVHNFCDRLIGLLLHASIIFAPWAFGTVHQWSIEIINSTGYALCLLGLIHWFTRPGNALEGSSRNFQFQHKPFFGLAFLSGLILIFIAIHWINGRADFNENTITFTFIPHFIPWLPHSYDRSATLEAGLQILAYFCYFWAIYYWLGEPKSKSSRINTSPPNSGGIELPPKTKAILICIALNGGVLALVGILQRLDHSRELLWIYRPQFRDSPFSHFGPFAYRGNAATYLNLVWCSTFYLFLRLRDIFRNGSEYGHRVGSGKHLILAPILLLITLAAFVTTSRAGLAVFVLQLIATLTIVLESTRKPLLTTALTVSLVGSIAASSFFVGAKKTVERLQRSAVTGFLPKRDSRWDIYMNLSEPIKHFWFWGSGPGTFSSIYAVHRGPAPNPGFTSEEKEQGNQRLVKWIPWAHSDPIEFLITYGIIGSSCFSLFIGIIIIRAYSSSRKNRTHSRILIVGLLGFTVHSFVDFPFQVVSLAHGFIVILALAERLTLHEISPNANKPIKLSS